MSQLKRNPITAVAHFFVRSHLTPLVIICVLLLGVFASITTPQEEEPRLDCPAYDVALIWPGHESNETDQFLARPVGGWIRELEFVDHVTSQAVDDGALIMVEFMDGLNNEMARTQLMEKLDAKKGLLPSGASFGSVTPRGNGDIPTFSIAIFSKSASPSELRKSAVLLARALQSRPGVGSVNVQGGASPAFKVAYDPSLLAARGIGPEQIQASLLLANMEIPAGKLETPNGILEVRAGAATKTVDDIRSLPLLTPGPDGKFTGVRIGDVARVEQTVLPPSSLSSFMGPETDGAPVESVLINLFQIKSFNAKVLTKNLIQWLDTDGQALMPPDGGYHVLSDLGASAHQKVTWMFKHMALATIIVALLVGLAIGFREALIVLVVIPCTLAIMPIVYWLTGETLNRMTLAAMIFAIGILVDDAIVVIENVGRRFSQRIHPGETVQSLTGEAVGEVALPTVLATIAVIAALLPLAFISGMVGQYVRPLPVGSSCGMVWSLIVAITITPWFTARLLRRHFNRTLERQRAKERQSIPTDSADVHQDKNAKPIEEKTPSEEAFAEAPENKSTLIRLYAGMLRWILASRLRIAGFILTILCLFVAAMSLVVRDVVALKTLPVSEADSIAVVVDMPPGTHLSETDTTLRAFAASLRDIPQFTSIQTYAGSAGPLDYQGVLRHYMFRNSPHHGEIQVRMVHFTDEGRGGVASHDLASELRRRAAAFFQGTEAYVTVAEVPPGPPTLAMVVAEVYGQSREEREMMAKVVRSAFEEEAGIVDVDDGMRPGLAKLSVEVNQSDAAMNGVLPVRAISATKMLLSGSAMTTVTVDGEPERLPILVQPDVESRLTQDDILQQRIHSVAQTPVQLSKIATVTQKSPSYAPMRKDLTEVINVTGELEGLMVPMQAVMRLTHKLSDPDFIAKHAPGMTPPKILFGDEAVPTSGTSLRWAGEWTLTFSVFRDLGLAFAAVLFLIYVMLVAWYGSYGKPLIIMLPIPLSLIGVLPAHALIGIPLSSLGIVGVIALAGIMVRNSILLIDFADIHRAQGMSPTDAIVMACEDRCRPILLTAGAVIFGDATFCFEPLLQGLGVTMFSGALISTLLTLVVIPAAFIFVQKHPNEPDTPVPHASMEGLSDEVIDTNLSANDLSQTSSNLS